VVVSVVSAGKRTLSAANIGMAAAATSDMRRIISLLAVAATTACSSGAPNDVPPERATGKVLDAPVADPHCFVPIRIGAVGSDCCSHPVDINESSDVLVSSQHYEEGDGGFPQRAFVWRAGTRIMIDLPEAYRDFNVEARDINDRGEVVGLLYGGSRDLPFVWRSGTMTVLETPSGGHGNAEAINNAGVIAGSIFGGDRERAVVWRDGVAYDIGIAGRATAINEAGHVIGLYDTPRGGRSFFWDGGTPVDLGTVAALDPASELLTFATDINDRDQVVGQVNDSAAVFWQAGVLRTLSPSDSEAMSINNSGVIAGTGEFGVVVWRGDTQSQLGPGRPSQVSETGWIVGSSEPDSPDDSWSEHAMLWHGGGRLDLGALTGRLSDSRASRINTRGDIAGEENFAEEEKAILWKNTCASGQRGGEEPVDEN